MLPRALIRRLSVLVPSLSRHWSRDGPHVQFWPVLFSCSVLWRSSFSLLMPLPVCCPHHFFFPSFSERVTFTGGRMKPAGAKTPLYGDWNPNLVRFRRNTGRNSCSQPIQDLRRLDLGRYLLRHGRAHSSCHVGRANHNANGRIWFHIYSPADIVGGNVSKLRRMDATVVCFDSKSLQSSRSKSPKAHFLRSRWNCWRLFIFLCHQSLRQQL